MYQLVVDVFVNDVRESGTRMRTQVYEFINNTEAGVLAAFV